MKKTTIGGQALIEGLLMIGPKSAATAVRKSNGEIIVEKTELPPKGLVSKIPIVRGVVNFAKQMYFGMKALIHSAELADIDGEVEEPSRFDRFIERIFGDKLKDAVIYFSVILAVVMSVGLFILLPNFLVDLIKPNEVEGSRVIIFNLFEGLIRLALFLGYLALVSRMQDIKRVWQYHGAEHKTIFCYENGQELTVENVRNYSTKHPRCGTSFLFIVMLVSIVVFSLVGWHGMWLNILFRILLIPLVAGISYELLKMAGRSESKIAKLFNAPGIALQRLTTREPEDDQIEVAIVALKSVLVEDKDADNW